MNSPKSESIQIKQKCLYLADMNPGRKSKPGKTRPVLVIQSTDTIEAGSPGIVTIPCSSQLREGNILRLRIKPGADLHLSKESDLLLDQIHTIDRSLFVKHLGELGDGEWSKVQKAVWFLLD